MCPRSHTHTHMSDPVTSFIALNAVIASVVIISTVAGTIYTASFIQKEAKELYRPRTQGSLTHPETQPPGRGGQQHSEPAPSRCQHQNPGCVCLCAGEGTQRGNVLICSFTSSVQWKPVRKHPHSFKTYLGIQLYKELQITVKYLVEDFIFKKPLVSGFPVPPIPSEGKRRLLKYEWVWLNYNYPP